MRSIGFRLGLLVFGCFLIAFASASGVIYALHITDSTIDRALDAQRRLDLLTEISGRISSYGLSAISGANDPRLRETKLKDAETAVYAAIQAFEPEIAKEMEHTDQASAAYELAARAKPLEQVRAGFRVMVRQIDDAFAQDDPQNRSDSIRGAFNGFATMTGPYLFFLMQADRRGVDAARTEARAVSTTLSRAAFGLVTLALIAALVMYRLYHWFSFLVAGTLPSGPPGYVLELWVATSLLCFTFPVIAAYSGFFSYWPLSEAKPKA